MPAERYKRHLPVGAETLGGGSVDFRIWAPKCQQMHLCLSDAQETPQCREEYEMLAEPGGYFSTTVAACESGTLYGFRLNGAEAIRADPASRFQPQGVFGWSEVVDPHSFPWSDQAWQGVKPAGQVIYEMHVGSFTREGTWRAAAQELPELARTGMTLLEVMPVADFAGRFGWGYDGVLLFAPARLYGRPDDFRFFVDRAHAAGLGVVLDVVYNHFGSVGNYLRDFSDDYITDAYPNEWSDAVNFDGPGAGPVREMFLANIRYWIEEFHVDGFRFDATHAIHDASTEHILATMTRTARAIASPREILLIGENGPQDVRMFRPVSQAGYGLDMLWNDDFHHSARVCLTGESEAYYSDFRGQPAELLAAAKWGFLYQGQRSKWQREPRGTSTRGIPAASFITFLENHDQLANSGAGKRPSELASPGKYRAMTAHWLLAPQTPMFFQGQEFSASTPFLYFADFSGDEAAAVAKGRINFLSQFPSLATPEAKQQLPEPNDPKVFRRCQLDFGERKTHHESYALHIDLLKLRREDPVFSRQSADQIDGAEMSTDCFILRYFEDQGDDRLLLVNFGRDVTFSPVPQPLLAPPMGRRWEQLWSSESVEYGGRGTPAVETDDGWRIPSETAIVLRAIPELPSTPPRTKGADP
ncbi:MAG: malto-oligosyltrehalose trehalohydrolase [Planctomycetes bacterium]|nr:malto-oligosyltrehalose trehalohydrolase [Planctomycetota bacterium]